jgi:serine/threonine protein kinase
MGKVFDPTKTSRIALSSMNPNTALPILRETNKILNQRLVTGAKKTKANFRYVKQIANGQYGPVWLVERLPNREPMVVKEMSKLTVYRKQAVDTVLNEQRLLTELMSPFLGNLRYAFQDLQTLYLVNEYVPGGDLGYYLHVKKKEFSQVQARWIMANMILAVEFLHINGVIHRDLRPENFVFTANGYLKLIDIGLARVWQP